MSVTLLLADDSITIQRVIELTFADEHVRVVSAIDGQQAILKIDAERPDIVLADVGMPKLDGYAVAAHVKQTPSLSHIPVLLLTGAFEPIDEAKARATGCDGILVKPFKPEQLIERVRELLAGQRNPELWPADLPRVETPAARVPQAPTLYITSQPSVPPAPAPSIATTPVLVVPQSVAPPSAPLVMAPRMVPPPAPPPAPVRVAVPAPPPEPVALPQAPSLAPVFSEPPSNDQDMLRPASRNAHTAAASRTPLPSRELPPPADAFDSELDMLDVALSRLEPTASPQQLDAATASDFARDLEALRNEQPDEIPLGDTPSKVARDEFGDWDLPKGRGPITPSEHMAIGFDLDESDAPRAADRPRADDGFHGVGAFDALDASGKFDALDASGEFDALDASREFAAVDVVPVEMPASAVPPSPLSLPPLAHPEPAVIISPQAPSAVVVRPSPWAAAAAVNVAAPSAPIPPAAPPLRPIAERLAESMYVAPRAPVPVVRTAAPVALPAAAPAPRPSLANAFSALLAAEQAQPVAHAAAPNTLSESAIEDVVKRVLTRMTDEAIQRVVLDAAERIIREEIERLKSPSNSSGH